MDIAAPGHDQAGLHGAVPTPIGQGALVARLAFWRLVPPDLLAGLGFQRNHIAAACIDHIEKTIDEQRRVFPGTAELAGIVDPGGLQPGHVFGVDLIEG